MRHLAWFSCGASSAVASKMMVEKHPDTTEVVYIDTHSEHPDNIRFLHDCEEWIGQEIKILSSSEYADIWDVFEKTRYLVGVGGARCTLELKKRVRQQYEDLNNDIQVFGFTVEERQRAERFTANNPEINSMFPLIEHSITKNGCLTQLINAGIELPMMYQLGYKNNNCIGCVKGQAGYWNKIRVDFPDVFERMSKTERDLDVAINKRYENGERIRVFLDELPPTMGQGIHEGIQCDLFCSGLRSDDGRNDGMA